MTIARVLGPLGLALLLAAGTASATIVQSLSLDEISRKADVIVHGTVVEQSTAWNETRTRIYTVTTVEVKDRVKGQGETRIRIRQLGGTVDGITQSIVGNARMAKGEEVVLFLTRDTAKDLHYVVGMAQGKYAVDRQAPEPVVRHELEGLALARIEDGALAELKAPEATQVALPTLAAFKAQIRQAISAAP
ncbi:MAG: hypothetical protein H6706_14870 [Myxococcales bacterium]|nr:hypothetical protein [Myxococcales bacterium]